MQCLSRCLKFIIFIPTNRYIVKLVFIKMKRICTVSFIQKMELTSFYSNWFVAYFFFRAKETIYKMACLHVSVSPVLFFIYTFDDFQNIHKKIKVNGRAYKATVLFKLVSRNQQSSSAHFKIYLQYFFPFTFTTLNLTANMPVVFASIVISSTMNRLICRECHFIHD